MEDRAIQARLPDVRLILERMLKNARVRGAHEDSVQRYADLVRQPSP